MRCEARRGAWRIAVAAMLAVVLAAPLVAQPRPTPRPGGSAETSSDRPVAVAARAGSGATGEAGLGLVLALSRPVPWRAFTLADPPRLVIDLGDADLSDLDPERFGTTIRTGRMAPGWTRLVLELDGPQAIARAWMETAAPGARLLVATRDDPSGGADGPLIARDWDAVAGASTRPAGARDPAAPLVIALDPGHGGLDPGAQRDGLTEADLMLAFARELAEVLRGAGHTVVLTRDDDSFLALRGRPGAARAGGADALISLHADAVVGGGAAGATVYSLSETSADAVTADLVARHDRADLLMGVTVPPGSGDAVAGILVDLARAETAPRADALADAIAGALGAAGLRLHKRPRRGAAFTVLTAPDIPSVLVELGFMSDPTDLANLRDPAWRARMARALAHAVGDWAVDDARRAGLLRR